MENLKNFKIEDGVLLKYTGNGRDVVIPEGVTSIGDDAFADCTSLTSVVIPDSVTSIGDDAFAGCCSLTSVTFNKNSRLTGIGSEAFFKCKSLTSIEIPNSVTSIGEVAFWGCTSLTIYCQVASKPRGWGGGWSAGCPVVWSYKNNYVQRGVL